MTAHDSDPRLPVYTDPAPHYYVGRYRFPVAPELPAVRIALHRTPLAVEVDPDAIIEPVRVDEVSLRRGRVLVEKRDTGQVESVFLFEVDALLCDPADGDRLWDSIKVVDHYAEDPIRAAVKEYSARLLDLRLTAVAVPISKKAGE